MRRRGSATWPAWPRSSRPLPGWRWAGRAGPAGALAGREGGGPSAPPIPPRAALDELSSLAARDGLEGGVPFGGGRARLHDVARALVERARPHARELGSEPDLDGLAEILERGNGAQRQRAALADGGPRAVLELLARETAEG